MMPAAQPYDVERGVIVLVMSLATSAAVASLTLEQPAPDGVADVVMGSTLLGIGRDPSGRVDAMRCAASRCGHGSL